MPGAGAEAGGAGGLESLPARKRRFEGALRPCAPRPPRLREGGEREALGGFERSLSFGHVMPRQRGELREGGLRIPGRDNHKTGQRSAGKPEDAQLSVATPPLSLWPEPSVLSGQVGDGALGPCLGSCCCLLRFPPGCEEEAAIPA